MHTAAAWAECAGDPVRLPAFSAAHFWVSSAAPPALRGRALKSRVRGHGAAYVEHSSGPWERRSPADIYPIAGSTGAHVYPSGVQEPRGRFRERPVPPRGGVMRGAPGSFRVPRKSYTTLESIRSRGAHGKTWNRQRLTPTASCGGQSRSGVYSPVRHKPTGTRVSKLLMLFITGNKQHPRKVECD